MDETSTRDLWFRHLAAWIPRNGDSAEAAERLDCTRPREEAPILQLNTSKTWSEVVGRAA